MFGSREAAATRFCQLQLEPAGVDKYMLTEKKEQRELL